VIDYVNFVGLPREEQHTGRLGEYGRNPTIERHVFRIQTGQHTRIPDFDDD
jgi:hypothetical protein